MMIEKQYLSHSPEETMKIGRQFGEGLPEGSVVTFFGDLAAGKTTFIKGLVSGTAHIDPYAVQSPTFTYLHIYEGEKKVYHFDLYRLKDADEFLSMGFDDYFGIDGICCVEWSERIEKLLPSHIYQVMMCHGGGDRRHIRIVHPMGL